ncbi:MAG: ribosome biogenesis GTPase Der [bacterium]
MSKKLKYPQVLLVGRTNVGKSTLFNRISNKKSSIVFEREGVTRDYVQELITWNDVTFKLVDTGGLSFTRKTSEIEAKVQKKVLDLLAQADLLLFVCDVKAGVTQDDVHIVRTLHKTKRPIFLLINKVDNQNAFAEHKFEFESLGIKEVFPVSSLHGIGIGQLLDHIIRTIPAPIQEEPAESKAKIVILGKPNVGKSSLMNLLTHQDRSIISAVPGTTREAITDHVYFCDELVQITDTAGVRRQSRVSDDLETLMVKSSLQSIRQADVVLLMIDASEGKISDQEVKLLAYTLEQKKPVIVLYNKTDLLESNDYAKTLLDQSIDEYDFILKKTTQISISCLSKKNICKILGQVQKVLDRCKQPFDSGQLNELIKQEMQRKPLYHKRQLLKVFHIKHIKTAPTPTFAITVNHPEWFGPTQLGFVENVLRKNYDLKGCPVQFNLKKQ